MTAPRPVDSLFPPSLLFGLGRPYGEVHAHEGALVATAVRPFGLRFAVSPPVVTGLDLDAMRYDPVRQVGMMDTPDGLVPLARHTTGSTSTVTHADGQGRNDSDSDVRED